MEFGIGDKLKMKCPVACGIVRTINTKNGMRGLTAEEWADDSKSTFTIKRRWTDTCDQETLKDGTVKKIDPPEMIVFYGVLFDDGVKGSFGEDFLNMCEVSGCDGHTLH